MAKLVLFVVSIIFLLYFCEAYKILVVYPFPAKSHNNLGNGVVRHLLTAGHEVTYITPFPLTNPHPNLRQVDVNSIKENFPVDSVNIKALMHKEVQFADDDSIFLAVFNLAKSAVMHKDVQTLLNDPTQQFDVVVAEWMYNELYAGFAAAFNCPYLWILPYEPYVNTLSLIDEAPNPAYSPNVISDNVPPYTFTQRVQELWNQIQSVFYKKLFHEKIERDFYEECFGPVLAKKGRPLPSFEELRYNASMILGNTNPATGLPIRLPQNFKSIAGFYIEENVKPLPQDIKKVIDKAKHGVIYFSLGSNLKSKDLPDEIKTGLKNMFGEFKETVVWKFEEELTDLPDNVHVIKWAPQQSVLAHPNCKLFITHGGLLSTTEAVHFGVPTIGIPVFVDQFNNVNRIVERGAAKRLDISYSLPDDLRKAIHEMISDHRYTERAKELSMIFHDRPVSPGAELVHWVEHVVRTRGALHLRSPALHVPWYQKMYLDLAALILLTIFLLKVIVKRLFAKCFYKSKVTIAQKKKQK
ncbi:UDP-glucosyltransferase 2-like [Pectinophora gossypiella]|uniref:UDP-glucosyltransferase 2-like n=1 Tax=Pectinophora gossypiella TaxID=13191 RepID=UPI00214E71FE|nr:UDP-glucosyltransferase 2-like [Pectinophora gossypiella]